MLHQYIIKLRPLSRNVKQTFISTSRQIQFKLTLDNGNATRSMSSLPTSNGSDKIISSVNSVRSSHNVSVPIRTALMNAQFNSPMLSFPNNAAVTEQIQQDLNTKQRSVSLNDLQQFGPKPSHDNMISSALFLHNELRVRLAHRINDLVYMPYGLNNNKHISQVRDLYLQSYSDLLHSPIPKNYKLERDFRQTLHNIYERHGLTLISMASGVHELKMKLMSERKSLHSECKDVHSILDQFYMSRVGIRLLIAQHISLGNAADIGDSSTLNEDYIGLIHRKTSPYQVAQTAIRDASGMCERHLGVAPYVSISGEESLTLPYLPSHLHHVMFEILKNSMKATVDFHSENGKRVVDADTLPPIKVVIADGKKHNDVCIKITDFGGGIPRSKTERVFDYFYSTSKPSFNNLDGTAFSLNSPFSGLGYGLPLSRMYTRYFGGDLKLISMENMGTDIFIYLRRGGHSPEPLSPTLFK